METSLGDMKIRAMTECECAICAGVTKSWVCSCPCHLLPKLSFDLVKDDPIIADHVNQIVAKAAEYQIIWETPWGDRPSCGVWPTEEIAHQMAGRSICENIGPSTKYRVVPVFWPNIH